MSREVRITIDDDEVFERMKRRKAELDLSWEEVLHRGLRHDDHDHPGDVGDEIAREIESRVANSLRNVFGADSGHGPTEPPGPAGTPGPAGRPGPQPGHQPGTHGETGPSGGYDDDFGSIASAEDAVLSFDFLDGGSATEVPLRVDLTSGVDGLDVTVVTVRQGKGTEGMNEFEAVHRKQVAQALARGDYATLRLGEGEEYRVSPVCSWTRDASGRASVTDVEIDAVHLDVE